MEIARGAVSKQRSTRGFNAGPAPSPSGRPWPDLAKDRQGGRQWRNLESAETGVKERCEEGEKGERTGSERGSSDIIRM
ncbi:Hypothetical protein NTJ_13418 [Nesidiocoris tenuis]|uniref:Uncharacterized protein n=1 Tax=Nesidiocoris tenuis TaxID=355587 RepID=A0ABN7B896_9HEMI|nr:Hypothetical protein NTJ_13418 [Nesidiocoris tenuis]